MTYFYKLNKKDQNLSIKKFYYLAQPQLLNEAYYLLGFLILFFFHQF